jgi:hypothetical protein
VNSESQGAHIMTSDGEVEGPDDHVDQAPRAHTVPKAFAAPNTARITAPLQ